MAYNSAGSSTYKTPSVIANATGGKTTTSTTTTKTGSVGAGSNTGLGGTYNPATGTYTSPTGQQQSVPASKVPAGTTWTTTNKSTGGTGYSGSSGGGSNVITSSTQPTITQTTGAGGETITSIKTTPQTWTSSQPILGDTPIGYTTTLTPSGAGTLTNIDYTERPYTEGGVTGTIVTKTATTTGYQVTKPKLGYPKYTFGTFVRDFTSGTFAKTESIGTGFGLQKGYSYGYQGLKIRQDAPVVVQKFFGSENVMQKGTFNYAIGEAKFNFATSGLVLIPQYNFNPVNAVLTATQIKEGNLIRTDITGTATKSNEFKNVFNLSPKVTNVKATSYAVPINQYNNGESLLFVGTKGTTTGKVFTKPFSAVEFATTKQIPEGTIYNIPVNNFNAKEGLLFSKSLSTQRISGGENLFKTNIGAYSQSSNPASRFSNWKQLRTTGISTSSNEEGIFTSFGRTITPQGKINFMAKIKTIEEQVPQSERGYSFISKGYGATTKFYRGMNPISQVVKPNPVIFNQQALDISLSNTASGLQSTSQTSRLLYSGSQRFQIQQPIQQYQQPIVQQTFTTSTTQSFRTPQATTQAFKTAQSTTTFQTPTTTQIPIIPIVTYPIITKPPIVPPIGFGHLPIDFSNKMTTRTYKGKRKYRYTPSYESFVFNIRGKRPRGIETGARVRPITKGFKFFSTKNIGIGQRFRL